VQTFVILQSKSTNDFRGFSTTEEALEFIEDRINRHEVGKYPATPDDFAMIVGTRVDLKFEARIKPSVAPVAPVATKKD